MPNTNGHGPKRAILYTRVSGEEQKKKGYSLDDQRDALRAWAAEEGYEVLEEVEDGAWSGGFLTRPGLDRVRELVGGGGVDAVAALYRDRFARGIYTQLLAAELAEHGTRLVALNSQGDDSPDGELADGIMDVISGWERKKIAERTKRGKLRKAREGKSVSPIPKYGFRFDAARDGLVVHEPEMAVVEKVFRMAAVGYGVGKIQSRLYAEGIPTPRGRKVWDRRVIRKIVRSDEYRPLVFEEIRDLVTPEVAARLDPDREYGVQWYNRTQVSIRTVSEPDGNGGREYKKRKTMKPRPKEEWLAIPVPAYLPRDLVDTARAQMDANKGSERKHLAREWELEGPDPLFVRVHDADQDHQALQPHLLLLHVQPTDRTQEDVLLYAEGPARLGGRAGRLGLRVRPSKRPRACARRHGETNRAGARGQQRRPGREAKVWAEKLEECAKLREGYQDQQAAGLMTLEELGAKLRRLEETRRTAERELAAIGDSLRRSEELEADRDALLESYADVVPGALNELSGGGAQQGLSDA